MNMINLAASAPAQLPPWVMIIYLVVIFGVMYFLIIRPNKKKQKEEKKMRENLQVGDEIVTIGGICGKIVKTKEDSFIIQVGADKTKFEMMRWAVSSVTKPSTVRESVEEMKEEAPKKALPKRLKKTSEVEEAEAAEATTEE